MPRLFKALFPACLLLAACGAVEETNTHPDGGPNDAGPEDAGDDGAVGLVCPASGVTKGPWSLAINDTSAKIRWEACLKGSPPEVIFPPEEGGAEVKVVSV